MRPEFENEKSHCQKKEEGIIGQRELEEGKKVQDLNTAVSGSRLGGGLLLNSEGEKKKRDQCS